MERGTKQAWSVIAGKCREGGGRRWCCLRVVRPVALDGMAIPTMVLLKRSGDGAQLPRGSLIVAQVKVATAGLVSQLVRQPQFSHQSAAPSDVAMGYGGW